MSGIQVATNKDSNATVDQEILDSLKADLRGSILLPTDPGYDEARSIWNGMIDRNPALIVRCRGVADVGITTWPTSSTKKRSRSASRS